MNIPPIIRCPCCNGFAVSTAHVLRFSQTIVGVPTSVLVLAHCNGCDRSWIDKRGSR